MAITSEEVNNYRKPKKWPWRLWVHSPSNQYTQEDLYALMRIPGTMNGKEIYNLSGKFNFMQT